MFSDKDAAPAACATQQGRRLSGVDAAWMLLATTLLWGASIPLIKWLTGYFEPVLLAGMRMATACAVLAIWLFLKWPHRRIRRRQLALIAACGALLIYGNQSLFTAGLALTSGTHVALILALNPAAATVLAAFLLKERPKPLQLVGLAMGFGGVAMAVVVASPHDLRQAGRGDLLVMLAVGSFAAGGLLVQRLAHEVDAATVNVGVHASGAILLLLHAALIHDPDVHRPAASALVWVVTLGSGVLITAVCNVLWNTAVGAVGAARASVWLYWLPVFGVTASVIGLRETLTVWHVLALAMVSAGTWLANRPHVKFDNRSSTQALQARTTPD